jgi:hypothetical protein
MKPYTYYSISEIQVIEGTTDVLAGSLIVGITAAQIFVAGFSCINPFMAILIKNILVLEFCSVLILLNLNFPQ